MVHYDVIAKAILDEFWVEQVKRAAKSCVDRNDGGPVILYPPTKGQYATAAETIRSATANGLALAD